MPQQPENISKKFNAGDPASKALDHKFLNSLTSSIGSLSQRTIGQPGIANQAGNLSPPLLPGAEIKLGKVLEVQTATGDFKGPVGAVNVIKFEVIDALFAETVGQQSLVEQDAASTVIYAAADTALSIAVDDFAWLTKWSGQWWVLSGGGGGGVELKHAVVREVCDETCGTYVVEIIERTFAENCTGTGTGTGTA
jgi:hypothetical protein